ncbi:PspA/IM30 family protein [Arenibacterium sp. CAU 1754]
MFGTLKTLIAGANARAEENIRDIYSIELIDQKIREAEAGLKAAKFSLASLIQRERAENCQIVTLNHRIMDLIDRAKEALENGREDLAGEAAQAIADMENEVELRQQAVSRLSTRVLRLRQSVETANRRIIDLRQGAMAARAVRKEQAIQTRLNRTAGGDSPMDEAADLIARVMKQDDPFEQSEILREIDSSLNHETVADRMAAEGFGAHSKSTASDVLKRLKS